MVDWLRPPKPKIPQQRDPYAYEYQNIPPQPPRQATQRKGFDESQLPPNLQRYHHGQRPPLSERLQERREEFREYYGPGPEQPQRDVPEPPQKRSKIPLILESLSVGLVLVGIVIAVINIMYVHNAGQTIQSITMLHGEMIVLLLALLLNTILMRWKK